MRASCVGAALVLAIAVVHGRQQPSRYVERVDVERVLVDVRVLHDHGRALTGLGADDFSVKIGGTPVPIESVMWVGGASSTEGGRPQAERHQLSSTLDTGRPGRLIIFLFQKDLEPSRIAGLMRMLVESQSFLDDLTPLDRIAVLSFDYRLKLWLDFTNDHTAVRQVMQRKILFEAPPVSVEPSSSVSLARGLAQGTAAKTYTIEKAMHRIADAIRDLPGSKSIVFVGHGFGRLGWTGVTMEHGYEEARDALMSARASVFSLDVTNATITRSRLAFKWCHAIPVAFSRARMSSRSKP